MKRLLFSILALAALGAALTGCAVHPMPVGGTVVIGTDGDDRHHDNGYHRGHHKKHHKHHKHRHDD